MEERIYNLTWGNTLSENMFIKSNCTPEFMYEAIEEKNKKKCLTEYDNYADSEVLEEILNNNGFTFEDITHTTEYIFNF